MRVSTQSKSFQQDWRWHLKNAVRDLNRLANELEISLSDFKSDFPLLVPFPYLNRIKKGDLNDPLLLQVLPTVEENNEVPGYILDPLQEQKPTNLPKGLIQKYRRRALIVAAAACSINCRYCFRRHFPYDRSRLNQEKWHDLMQHVNSDKSLREIIFSGGDPLILPDKFLEDLILSLNRIAHINTIRIHTRLPVVIPNRINPELISWVKKCRKKLVFVFHINHPNEINDEVQEYLSKIKLEHTVLLNQSVLLKRVNDSSKVLTLLSEKLFETGILPYYLHLLDPVKGTAHFSVAASKGMEIIKELKGQLPGYLIPRLAQEIPGLDSKHTFFY